MLYCIVMTIVHVWVFWYDMDLRVSIFAMTYLSVYISYT